MKTSSIVTKSAALPGISYLRNMTDQLINGIELSAFNQRSFILNDIPEEIRVDTDEELLISVLSDLLHEVVERTESGCIRLTAKTFNNIVLLHIKNDGLLDCDAMLTNLDDIHFSAERLGGFIGFTSFRNKVTTIAFSFRNMRD